MESQWLYSKNKLMIFKKNFNIFKSNSRESNKYFSGHMLHKGYFSPKKVIVIYIVAGIKNL